MKQMQDDTRYKQNVKHIFTKYKHWAYDLKLKKQKNFQYSYLVKTPNGFRNDDFFNHKYGDTRPGYETWKNDNTHLVDDFATTTLRAIHERKDYNNIIGYIQETKLPDGVFYDELLNLINECFDVLCEQLQVIDKETFWYFIFDTKIGCIEVFEEFNAKVDVIIDTFDRYHEDEDFKKLVDKIKN